MKVQVITADTVDELIQTLNQHWFPEGWVLRGEVRLLTDNNATVCMWYATLCQNVASQLSPLDVANEALMDERGIYVSLFRIARALEKIERHG